MTFFLVPPDFELFIFWKLGHKRRLGLIGAKRTTITVHRSEEVLPQDVGRHLVRQGTSVSSEGDAENELLVAQEGERWESDTSFERCGLFERCWFDKSWAVEFKMTWFNPCSCYKLIRFLFCRKQGDEMKKWKIDYSDRKLNKYVSFSITSI